MRVTYHFTREDRAANVYREVPFDVPAGAPAVSVAIAYDRASAVVDLGLFDTEGFRGWSGGKRDGFVITPAAATPGYLPGPLSAGTWNIVLGLHRVPPSGVDVTVTASVQPVQPPPEDPPPPRPERPPARDLPAHPGRRWVAADFHSHSIHSDGRLSLAALACLAAARGLDVLAVTDHNTVSHHPHLAAAGAHAGIRLLPGQEVTTETGHANCFGDVGWIDFRQPADTWLETAERNGGLASINHPLVPDYGWSKRLSRPMPLVEAWHASWDRLSDAPLEWWRARGGVPIGGSDFHRLDDAPPGSPTTWVEVEGDDVIGALAAGRVALSHAPRGPVLLSVDGDLVAVDADGATLVGADGIRMRVHGDAVRLPAAPGTHRLVDDMGRTLALVP
jgi:hypothetical protein